MMGPESKNDILFKETFSVSCLGSLAKMSFVCWVRSGGQQRQKWGDGQSSAKGGRDNCVFCHGKYLTEKAEQKLHLQHHILQMPVDDSASAFALSLFHCLVIIADAVAGAGSSAACFSSLQCTGQYADKESQEDPS